MWGCRRTAPLSAAPTLTDSNLSFSTTTCLFFISSQQFMKSFTLTACLHYTASLGAVQRPWVRLHPAVTKRERDLPQITAGATAQDFRLPVQGSVYENMLVKTIKDNRTEVSIVVPRPQVPKFKGPKKPGQEWRRGACATANGKSCPISGRAAATGHQQMVLMPECYADFLIF